MTGQHDQGKGIVHGQQLRFFMVKDVVSAVTETDGRVDAPVAVLRWTV
ncbi:MAG: hypothetical protein ABFD82_15310 [Syntrophaceae bacterium]